MLKKCKKCKIDKETQDFYKEPRNRDGLQGHCKKCNYFQQKEWVRKNRKKYRKFHKVYVRNWRIKNKEKVEKLKIEGVIRLKNDVLINYGNKCACCGETERDFLTLDHIENDGKLHRKILPKGGLALYYWARQNNYPLRLQILCFNCNWSKHLIKNKNRCTHQVLKS